MHKPIQVECPYCEGSCEIFDQRRVHAQSMEPPMSLCPACGGKGTVSEDEVDDIDCEKSLADYEEEYESEAAERRWELKNDR